MYKPKRSITKDDNATLTQQFCRPQLFLKIVPRVRRWESLGSIVNLVIVKREI